MITILALSSLVLNRKTITLISFSAAWLYLNMCHYISRPKKAQTACSRPTISCSAKYYTKAYPMAFDIFLKVGGLLLKVCAIMKSFQQFTISAILFFYAAQARLLSPRTFCDISELEGLMI